MEWAGLVLRGRGCGCCVTGLHHHHHHHVFIRTEERNCLLESGSSSGMSSSQRIFVSITVCERECGPVVTETQQVGPRARRRDDGSCWLLLQTTLREYWCLCVRACVCESVGCVCLNCGLVHVGVALKSTTCMAGSALEQTARRNSTSDQGSSRICAASRWTGGSPASDGTCS